MKVRAVEQWEAHLLSRAMSSFTKSRIATSTGTLTAVRPGNPGKGRDTVITPPSTESLVVVVTAPDGWGTELKVRPTRTSPSAGEVASLRKLCFHEITVPRLPVRALLRSAVVEACLTTFGVVFLLRPLLWTNRRSSAVERLTTALEQTLEHMSGGYLFALMQEGLLRVCARARGEKKSDLPRVGAARRNRSGGHGCGFVWGA